MRLTGYINGTSYEGDIDDSRLRGVKSKIKCPICPQMGKQHVSDTCLSVNTDEKVFKCHKCGWVGGWGDSIKHEDYKKIEYKTPDIGNLTDLTDKHLQHFSKRMITQPVLIRNKVKTAKNDWFAYQYLDGENVIKVKYKTPDKKMMQSPNSKPWIFKYNDLVGQDEVMICEGEEDALIWEVAGFNCACSVDMGAPNENDKNVDAKLQCITNCFDVFENAKTIYLAVDNDKNGLRLQKELIRMFGAEKCKIINFSPYKDSNDYALHNTPSELLNLKTTASDVKIEGIFMANELRDEIINNYRIAQPRGTTTYFNGLDAIWTWRPGEVNIWTGYNNEGKSQFLKHLQILKSVGDGWKHAIYSPEEWPINEWFTDLCETYIGKSADVYNKRFNNYMEEDELLKSIDFVNEHFFNIYPENDHTLEELFRLFSYAVRKYNIQSITLDPYNQIQHKMDKGEREDLYISRFMSMLKKFAVDLSVSVNLVSHQVTPLVERDRDYPEPNLYKIKGGGTFADKADNVIAVWREHRNTDRSSKVVKIISQKIKKQKLTGKPGSVDIKFDINSNRYSDMFDNFPINSLFMEKRFNNRVEEIEHVNDDFDIFSVRTAKF